MMSQKIQKDSPDPDIGVDVEWREVKINSESFLPSHSSLTPCLIHSTRANTV